jgi:acetyltransferase EpsM
MNLVLIGAGWHAREVCAYLDDINAAAADPLVVCGAIDELKAPTVSGPLPILGGFAALDAWVRGHAPSTVCYLTATGDNARREQFVRQVDELKLGTVKAWTLRHPQTVIGADAVLGEGTCIAPGAVITSHVRIGRHCIVNVKVSISHDCEIGDWVNLNPGATVCGNVRLGAGCYIGAGATIIDKVSIGEWSTIGAGAVVIDDIPPFVTAVGVPARVIDSRRRHPA